MVDCSMKCERFLVFALVSLWSSWYPRTEAVDGTCGADFLPSSMASSEPMNEGMQVVLLPAFAGCGHLMRYNVTANCPATGNKPVCNIVFQLWRPTGTGYLTLVNSNSTVHDPEKNNFKQEMLSFPLDMEFTVGDMVGFYLDQENPLIVHTAPADNHSYLQWSSMPNPSSMLRIADATNISARLPILNVESTCHPCPSTSQTMPISEQMSSSLTDDAPTSDGLPTSAITTGTSSGGQASSTSNGDSTTTVTAGATSAASSAQPSSSLPESVHPTSSPQATYQTSSTGPPETDTSTTAFSQSGSSAGFSLPSSPSSLPVPLTSSSAATSIVPTTEGLEKNDASSPVPSSPNSLPAPLTFISAATSIVSTTGELARSEAGSSVPSSPSSLPASPPSSSAATPIVPTTGGQEESGASAGVAAGVAVGLVLAVVVVVVVVVAVVLAAVCSVRRRKKYDFSGIVTYEVPPDTHIAANCCAEAAPYEMIPLSNGKGSPDGVYDVPCDMEEPKYSDGPFAYEVPSSSTLPIVYDTVSDDNAAENIILQGNPHYNMGCHGNGVLPTDGSEHEYQEADTVPQRTRPLLEECVEQEPFPIYGFVPTVGERSRLTLDESTEYELLKESCADHATETSAYYNNPSCVPRLEERGGTLASINSNVVDGVYETSSTDEDTYWSPSSKEEEIYAQMSRRKYQEIPRDKVKMLTKLGEGEFGEVYKAVLKTPTGTSQDVAVKVVKKGAPQEERLKLLQEAAILGQFKHRHVVSLFGVVTLGEPKMMIMDLLPGDLKSHLGQISETDSLRSDPDLSSLLLQFCKQVVDGLVCLAGKSFVHRDIAARNILLDKELNCKISDFGMTREVESETYYMLGKGAKIPVKWTAPEAILYKKYSTSSDIWSYGMLMYEIWSLGHKPFESNTVQEMVRLLDAHYCLPPPPGCPREVYSVMVDCWNPAHNERPTAADILGNFCKSERVLLAWRSEDPVPALSRTLGAPLSEGETLHRDLQNKYKDSLVKQ